MRYTDFCFCAICFMYSCRLFSYLCLVYVFTYYYYFFWLLCDRKLYFGKRLLSRITIYTVHVLSLYQFIIDILLFVFHLHWVLTSGDGNDINPAHPDTSMKLGRYVHKHVLFEIFSLANQNYSNFQDGGSKIQDGCQNKYEIKIKLF